MEKSLNKLQKILFILNAGHLIKNEYEDGTVEIFYFKLNRKNIEVLKWKTGELKTFNLISFVDLITW